VVSRFDADQILGVGESLDQRFEFSGRRELVPRSANEEFRLRALAEEIEIIGAIFDRYGGQAEGDQRADSVVAIGGPQSHGGSEGKSGEDYRERELLCQPIETCAHIFYFRDAIGVFTFAQSGAAEVEPEDGESESVKGFHGMEDNFIVQRSTVEGMRMADYGAVGCAGRSGIEETFQASGGTGQKQRTDAGGVGEHAT